MKEYTIIFTEQEMQDLAGFIDAGLRATGLRAAKSAAALADKLQLALNTVEPIIKDVETKE